MAARRRLGLILPDCADAWRRYNLEEGFAGIAREMVASGWEVDVLAAGVAGSAFPPDVGIRPVVCGPLPVIAGPGSAATTQSLRTGHLLWRTARSGEYDVLLGPLAGGLLQPCLMSRAVGESLRRTAILLWGDVPTAQRLLHDAAPPSVQSLVDDALERACLRLADAVVAPRATILTGLGALGAPPAACRIGYLQVPAAAPAAPAVRAPRTLMFVGRGTRGDGADRFLTAIEAMADRGRLPPAGVCFAGPWRETAEGLSKSLLGIRALGWTFPFEMLDDATPAMLMDLIVAREAFAVFAGDSSDDDVLAARLVEAAVPVAMTGGHRLAELLDSRVLAFPGDTQADRGDDIGCPTPPPHFSWRELIERERAARADECRLGASTPPAEPPTVSVCLTHRERPDSLAAAVASAQVGSGNPVEIVVADTGSTSPEASVALAALEAGGATVLRLGRMGQGAACDLAAHRASGEILAFLDDDNVYLGDGCVRLAEAVMHGPFDIVVANLALHDDPPSTGAAVAELVFLGDAGSAGLFFNGFGDMSFAIKRSAFLDLGGFRSHAGAAIDWVFLARARAAGLKIGVLQQPAVGYRRDLQAHYERWRKRDLEGARAAVLAAYHGRYDGDLVIKLTM